MNRTPRFSITVRLPSHIWACAAGICLALASPLRAQTLEQRIKPLVEAHAGVVSVAVKHLDKGDSFFHRADEPMPTASLIKLAVMIETYRQAREGQVDLTKHVVLRKEDMVPGSGILTTQFSAGASFPLRDSVRLMIAFSDNTATNLVLDQIGLPATAKYMEELGCPNTKIHAKVFKRETSVFPERSKQFGLGSTTAGEMLRLLDLLHKRELISPEASDAMKEHLLACDDKKKFPRLLPEGTKLAHKTGSVDAIRTDAGIIYSPAGPISLCILTNENKDTRWADDNAGDMLCAKIAKAVYDHFNPPAADKDAKPAANCQIRTGARSIPVAELARVQTWEVGRQLAVWPGGPTVPSGRSGRAATRSHTIRVPKQIDFQDARALASRVDIAIDPARRSFLSLRDPAGAKHAAGPPNSSLLGPLFQQAANLQDGGGEEEEEPADTRPTAALPELLPRDPLTGPPFLVCRAWAVAEAQSGKILWESRASEVFDTASTTKIMTAYVILKLAEEKPKVLDELVVFSDRADKTDGSSSKIRAGERIPVRELLYGLLLPSGNDAAIALAEHFGPRLDPPPQKQGHADPVARFVAEMNRTAAQLKLAETRYLNPNGLPEKGHASSARDLARLTAAARQLKLFGEYVSSRLHEATATARDGTQRSVVWKTTNRLLAISGYTGVKTGYTKAAGSCLVSSGERGRDSLIVVVLGAPSAASAVVDSRNLYRWAWRERGHKE
jgi:D-alanyl-D-alanine carboxypeptidase